MDICGIIAEYNPLHNGHLYHIERTKEALIKESSDPFIICVLSGHFTQRGEVAILDKWTRAKHAINAGASLVIELPTVYACSSAQNFANGAIDILKGLGCIDYLSFGSESDELKSLTAIATAYDSDKYSKLLQQSLSKGNTFAKASSEAIESIMGKSALLSSPNAILAIEYLKCIKGTSIKPLPIKRTVNSHNDTVLLPNITSVWKITLAYLSIRLLPWVNGS